MNWRWECQTCAKAKRDYGWGFVLPCDEDKCEPEAFKNTATTSSIPTKQYYSNKLFEKEQIEHLISLQKTWQISYGDDKLEQEYEKLLKELKGDKK